MSVSVSPPSSSEEMEEEGFDIVDGCNVIGEDEEEGFVIVDLNCGTKAKSAEESAEDETEVKEKAVNCDSEMDTNSDTENDEEAVAEQDEEDEKEEMRIFSSVDPYCTYDFVLGSFNTFNRGGLWGKKYTRPWKRETRRLNDFTTKI